MKNFNYDKMINHLAKNHLARHYLVNKVDKQLYKNIVEEDNQDLYKVKLRRYQFLSAMLAQAARNIDKGYISKSVISKLSKVFVGNSFRDNNSVHLRKKEDFFKKEGVYPPNFVVLSPTQKCNLNCTGCYAGSTARSTPTLPYSIVDKIVSDVHDRFDNRFMTISGGEPFLYESEGKTLLDIFEKYNDMFFLVYTNGTAINSNVAGKLAKLGNVTPAISVEGFEKETDARRGKGIHKKIRQAFQNLREAGVPFGVSATGTSQNVDVLLDDSFYEYYFDQQGATYMWQFQIMPIGRASNAFDLMISPKDRVKLFRKWEYLLEEKKYCIADFWNSGVITNGCIAYGRDGGYIYIDWNGNVTPCVFVPYSTDNVYELYKNGKSLTDALKSGMMQNGRKWYHNYSNRENPQNPSNLLTPCSIRDNYANFRENILTTDAKPIDLPAKLALDDDKYYKKLVDYDNELKKITQPVWEKEYLETENV